MIINNNMWISRKMVLCGRACVKTFADKRELDGNFVGVVSMAKLLVRRQPLRRTLSYAYVEW